MDRNCIEFRNCCKVACKLASLDFLAYLLLAETLLGEERWREGDGKGYHGEPQTPFPHLSSHPLSYALPIFQLPHPSRLFYSCVFFVNYIPFFITSSLHMALFLFPTPHLSVSSPSFLHFRISSPSLTSLPVYTPTSFPSSSQTLPFLPSHTHHTPLAAKKK